MRPPPEGVAQARSPGTEREDRQREHPDAPRHHAGALGVVAREIGGCRDVGHLEEAEGRRREDEGGDDPQRSAPHWRRRTGTANIAMNPTGRVSAPSSMSRWREPLGRQLAVAAGPDRRVDDDVPDLGHEHDDGGEGGGDPERVGQVVGEHETRQGAEAARPDAARGIPRGLGAGEAVTGHAPQYVRPSTPPKGGSQRQLARVAAQQPPPSGRQRSHRPPEQRQPCRGRRHVVQWPLAEDEEERTRAGQPRGHRRGPVEGQVARRAGAGRGAGRWRAPAPRPCCGSPVRARSRAAHRTRWRRRRPRVLEARHPAEGPSSGTNTHTTALAAMTRPVPIAVTVVRDDRVARREQDSPSRRPLQGRHDRAGAVVRGARDDRPRDRPEEREHRGEAGTVPRRRVGRRGLGVVGDVDARRALPGR